jgi:hypothetical protein
MKKVTLKLAGEFVIEEGQRSRDFNAKVYTTDDEEKIFVVEYKVNSWLADKLYRYEDGKELDSNLLADFGIEIDFSEIDAAYYQLVTNREEMKKKLEIEKRYKEYDDSLLLNIVKPEFEKAGFKVEIVDREKYANDDSIWRNSINNINVIKHGYKVCISYHYKTIGSSYSGRSVFAGYKVELNYDNKTYCKKIEKAISKATEFIQVAIDKAQRETAKVKAIASNLERVKEAFAGYEVIEHKDGHWYNSRSTSRKNNYYETIWYEIKDHFSVDVVFDKPELQFKLRNVPYLPKEKLLAVLDAMSNK